MNHGNVSPAIAKGLLALQKRIKAAKIPSSKIDESINVATWNIREFGKKPRTEAAIHYVAEILGQFDLVGLVELRDQLGDLRRVLEILGPSWRAVYSDVIADGGGNGERVGYLYDKRAVTFNGLAAEADAPRAKQGFEYLPAKSFWRAPYLAAFRSGNFDFVVLTTHIRWSENEDSRVEELGMLADWIEGKRRSPHAEDQDLIVMGDFNIPARGDRFFKALTKHGLKIPDKLLGLAHGTNLEKNKRYDQIMHYPGPLNNFVNSAGTVDFFIDDAHIKELFPAGMTREKFTYQLSDHLPLWLQINTDVTGQQLSQIIQGK